MPAMRVRNHVAALLFCLATGITLSAPLERSISPSRQFLIYGTNAQLRGAVSETAEQVKANLLSILHQPDNWKTPIVLHLQFPEANVPEIPRSALHFSQTGSGLKLQLDLVIGNDVNTLEIQRELLRAILLERIYRKQSDLAPGTVYVQPPDWLLDGLLAAAPGYDRAQLATIDTNKMMTLDEFLRRRPDQLDSPARQLYRAHSLALVQLLVDGTNGGARLARYIDNLSSASNDPLTDLKSQFPAFSSNDVEKFWQSNVSNLNTTQKFELVTFAETERKLDAALRIQVSEKKLRLEDFLIKKLSPVQKTALMRLSENLVLVGAAANPVLRPIASEYQQIAQLILAGKRKGLAERLARLKATRTKLVARMNDIDDYMNWFEATQSKTTSGAFADYLRTAAEHHKPESRRRDAISVYLDALEEQIHD
jgi:hypothetical protein